MRLVTHNMLKCNIKGVENGYPLTILVEKMEVIAMDYNPGLQYVIHIVMYEYLLQ
jgi:multifunctional methyltransferase subunit TRM112